MSKEQASNNQHIKSIVSGAYSGEVTKIEKSANNFLMGSIKKEVDVLRAEVGTNLSEK